MRIILLRFDIRVLLKTVDLAHRLQRSVGIKPSQLMIAFTLLGMLSSLASPTQAGMYGHLIVGAIAIVFTLMKKNRTVSSDQVEIQWDELNAIMRLAHIGIAISFLPLTITNFYFWHIIFSVCLYLYSCPDLPDSPSKLGTWLKNLSDSLKVTAAA